MEEDAAAVTFLSTGEPRIGTTALFPRDAAKRIALMRVPASLLAVKKGYALSATLPANSDVTLGCTAKAALAAD